MRAKSPTDPSRSRAGPNRALQQTATPILAPRDASAHSASAAAEPRRSEVRSPEQEDLMPDRARRVIAFFGMKIRWRAKPISFFSGERFRPLVFDRAGHMGYTGVWRIPVSGLQEILVIVLLFVLIIFLPRRLARGGKDKKPGKIVSALSGRARLGVIVSAVWLLSWTVYFRPWSGETLGFVLIALCPVILGWGALWVADGFKKNQDA